MDEVFNWYRSPRYYIPKDAIVCSQFIWIAIKREATIEEINEYNFSYIGDMTYPEFSEWLKWRG